MSNDLQQTNASQFPRPEQRTNASLNIAVLQRHNPSILAVLSIAPYAVIYTFSALTATWEKTGTEGTLFVCQLEASGERGSERFEVFVLNRRGLENFELELLAPEDVELLDDFIVLHEHGSHHQPDSENQAVFALWIFSEPPPSSTAEMRNINVQIIQECARRAKESKRQADAQRSFHGGALDLKETLDVESLRSSTRNHDKSSRANESNARDQPSLRELFGRPEQMASSATQRGQFSQSNNRGSSVLDDLFMRARQDYPSNA